MKLGWMKFKVIQIPIFSNLLELLFRAAVIETYSEVC